MQQSTLLLRKWQFILWPTSYTSDIYLHTYQYYKNQCTKYCIQLNLKRTYWQNKTQKIIILRWTSHIPEFTIPMQDHNLKFSSCIVNKQSLWEKRRTKSENQSCKGSLSFIDAIISQNLNKNLHQIKQIVISHNATAYYIFELQHKIRSTYNQQHRLMSLLAYFKLSLTPFTNNQFNLKNDTSHNIHKIPY